MLCISRCLPGLVFSIDSCRLLFIASYITPSNSTYKRTEIFTCLQNLIKCFRFYHIFVVGDLNARCGNVIIPPQVYVPNPDPIINLYGKNLMRLCKENGLVLVNGLKCGSTVEYLIRTLHFTVES